jgi:hypothetical protein
MRRRTPLYMEDNMSLGNNIIDDINRGNKNIFGG